MMLSARIRRSPAATRLLFGVAVPAPTTQGHWDLTTLALRRALDGMAAPGMRVLEMGCGEVGVLSIHACRRHAAAVLATDVSADAIASARASFARNGANIEARVSNLFEAIGEDEAFDLILFNPPYVPTSFGTSRGLDEPARVWDGGKDGAGVIRRFLAEAPARLRAGTRILLGFNTRHVGEAVVVAEAAAHGLAVTGRVAPWWSPAVVLVLARRAIISRAVEVE